MGENVSRKLFDKVFPPLQTVEFNFSCLGVEASIKNINDCYFSLLFNVPPLINCRPKMKKKKKEKKISKFCRYLTHSLIDVATILIIIEDTA